MKPGKEAISRQRAWATPRLQQSESPSHRGHRHTESSLPLKEGLLLQEAFTEMPPVVVVVVMVVVVICRQGIRALSCLSALKDWLQGIGALGRLAFVKTKAEPGQGLWWTRPASVLGGHCLRP